MVTGAALEAETAQPDTYFAPAERAGAGEVSAQRTGFLSHEVARSLLEAMPDLALVLNSHRQILATNERLLRALGIPGPEAILGQRPGEAVGCIHAYDHPGGCGTGPHCSVCGAVTAVMACLQTGMPAAHECRIQTTAAADGGALDLEALASPLVLGDTFLVVVALRDISDEKRRAVLERAFLHDLMNTAHGIRCAAELLNHPALDPQRETRLKHDLLRMAREMTEEITSHRELLAAESGNLTPRLSLVPVPELLQSVADLYRSHGVARERTLDVGRAPDCALETDPTLLRRVLGNLVKNALEATPAGGAVALGACAEDAMVRFRVHNPGVMPDAVQKQIFQRSFSTKGEPGRGIGTYSVKLLTERYLGGRVSFTSAGPEGTLFTVALPKRAPSHR